MKSNPKLWPNIVVFKENTDWAQRVMEELEVSQTSDWATLYKARSDGSLWRLDARDKQDARFLVKIEEERGWAQLDISNQVKELLLESRGGNTNVSCLQSNCKNFALKGFSFCVEHVYDRGIRV